MAFPNLRSAKAAISPSPPLQSTAHHAPASAQPLCNSRLPPQPPPRPTLRQQKNKAGSPTSMPALSAMGFRNIPSLAKQQETAPPPDVPPSPRHSPSSPPPDEVRPVAVHLKRPELAVFVQNRS